MKTTLDVGDRIECVCGTYKGHLGVVTDVLPVKVWVRLDKDSESHCIFQRSVKVIESEPDTAKMQQRQKKKKDSAPY